MPKTLALGNGNMLVCLDKYAQVRDLYYPHVGLENHVGGHLSHRIGVWVDGEFNWLSNQNWNITTLTEKDALMGNIEAVNKRLGVVISFSDAVYNEKTILVRKVSIKNTSEQKKRVRIFFSHEFEIYESHRGDTAYYDPMSRSVIHYNGRRVFLINGMHGTRSFSDYTTGVYRIHGKEGSFKDAEDGTLSKNPIEHGPTDSAVAFHLDIEGGATETLHYWLIAAKSIKEAQEFNGYVLSKSPDHLLKTTHDFWSAWVHKHDFHFFELESDVVELFKKSLFFIRSHSDNLGGIIASGDSDMLQGGKDTYGYVWPRDAAFSAIALARAGDPNVAQRFFRFCNGLITDDGYFMHKYRPDGSLGSSWHPWVRDGKIQLPIQEDETALVVYSLWKYYETSKDIEFIENIYNSLIEKAANFMIEYRDKKTGLPKPSYDLWEEKYGISTFTACSVYGGLIAAANFANLFGKKESATLYKEAAMSIRESILKYLYDENQGYFYKLINVTDGTITPDKTFDMSSVYGVFAFDVLSVDDPRLVSTIQKVEERLSCRTFVGGIARYEQDQYYHVGGDIPGNPWFITTLWLAQYYIKKAKKSEDFEPAKKWFRWAVDHSLKSGVLSEQLNTYTGEQLSAAPLTWSHAEFVISVIQYLDKLEELGICLQCDPIN